MLAVLACVVLGCAKDQTALAEKIEIKLLGAVACVPGKPIVMPGSEVTGGRLGRKLDAAYVWLDVREGGRPIESSGGEPISLRAKVRFADGWSADAFPSSAGGCAVLIAIPGGYAKKPEYVNLDLIWKGKPAQTFRIYTLATPVHAILDREPLMPNPRWKVRQVGNDELQVQILNQVPGRVSIVALKRATSIDFAGDQWFPEIKLEAKAPGAQSFYAPWPPQGAIELEEKEYRYITEHCRLTVTGLKVENVFDSPVLNVVSAASVTTPSGYKFEIPRQRIIPLRAGSKVSHQTELKITASAPVIHDRRKHLASVTPVSEVEKISADLASFGINKLKINAEGSANLKSKTIAFSLGSPNLKVGQITALRFDIVLTRPELIATYKGIVRVAR